MEYKKLVKTLKKEIQQQLQREQEISTASLAILILDIYKRLEEIEFEIESMKNERSENKVVENKEVVVGLLKYFK